LLIGTRAIFDVRYGATTERFTAITRTNHRGDEMASAFRQQCFDAVVEEEALRGPSIGDQIAAALCHAFYLALKNDHPMTALAIVSVLLCEWIRSRVSTLAAAVARRRASYCVERSKEFGDERLTQAVYVLYSVATRG
jgi:hypothetical protein